MTQDGNSAPAAATAPLFQLDLGANGGLLAPTTIDELGQWLAKEQQYWIWLHQGGTGSHAQPLSEAVSCLNQALNDTTQARNYWEGNRDYALQQLRNAQSQINAAFVERRLPYSGSRLGKRVGLARQEYGDLGASFFLAAMLGPLDSGHQFQALTLGSWRGLLAGLGERFSSSRGKSDARVEAAGLAFDVVVQKAETVIGEKMLTYDALHRDYQELATNISSAATSQAETFKGDQEQRIRAFEEMANGHREAMRELEEKFNEKMALRAPADYWRKKQVGHCIGATLTGILSFAGIGSAAGWLGLQVHDLLNTAQAGKMPDTWRIALLATLGVFSVWALRLLVRMFLSHLHLLGDAAERVVMVQTYLSLMEGDKLSDKEDRRLILQALFRPASDGIVKDEGIPLSLAELLTKTSK
ncbi:DUF6161 domain-containing protein [Roseateles sp. So40a]|uniref:DUF6161 domain-containing protein n=1 Tax=Roseateles sp. So40a TaxID=3400226 RepID=UPI003A845F0B